MPNSFNDVCTIPFLFHNCFSPFPNIYNLVNVVEDCPIFEGMFNFFQISAGGSVGTNPPSTYTQIFILYIIFNNTIVIYLHILIDSKRRSCEVEQQ